MNRLLVIDGNAVLHRAFHALPPLTSPDGRVTNAVYGFASMLIRLMSDLTPTGIAVAFDRPTPTFRKTLYKEYQSKRPEMDETLVSQIPLTHEMLETMRVATFEMDGFEADDVIGTLCQKIMGTGKKKQNRSFDQIIIVTGDRDILQLVEDDHVLLYMPTKGLSEAKLYGEKETMERLGVAPKSIPDFKALAGDPSDNYPGVTGIGPKTAVELLHTYKTVENVLSAAKTSNDIRVTLREKLVAGEEIALLSKDLATIRCDVPIDVDEKKLAVPDFHTQGVKDFFLTLGFTSLLKRLNGGEKESKTPVEKKQKKEETSVESSQISLL